MEADAVNSSTTQQSPQSEEEAMASAYRRAMGDDPEAGSGQEADDGSTRELLRDEKGRFVSRQAKDEDGEKADQAGADEAQADEAAEDSGGVDPWQALPEPIREKVGQLEAFARPWAETLSQHNEYLSRVQQETGFAPHDVVARLLQTEQMLRYGTYEQKQALLQQMAQDYGVALPAQAAGSGEDGDIDSALFGDDVPLSDPRHPHYAQYHDLIQQNAELKARLEALEAQQREAFEQQQQAEIARHIEEFRSATDENGQPKYPHFDLVQERMGALLEAGQAQSLEEAYTLAVKPVEERLAALAQEQAARAARAKSASGVNVETQAGMSEQNYQSIDEAMAAAYRSVMKH